MVQKINRRRLVEQKCKEWTEAKQKERIQIKKLREIEKKNEESKKLQELLEHYKEETTMEDKWKGIKEALTSTCQEVLGSKKHQHKEWISTETLEKIQERKNKKTAIDNSRTRAEKVKTQAAYTEANKRANKIITSEEDKYKEQKNVTSILQFNNFPMKIISSILKQDSLVCYNNDSNEMPWIGTAVLPYRHGTTEELQIILKHHRIKTQKSKLKYQEWCKKKTEEEYKKIDYIRQIEFKIHIAERTRKEASTVAYDHWLKSIGCKKSASHYSHGYSDGKLIDYYDRTANPSPSFVNPNPWINSTDLTLQS
ncbi:unnamed protein product [Schistosoma margrebowiei]|uniref:Coiled-coil domain-containing protein n=1 Tax=Schistosoma margrebowiei TaxID=48269 RepID=A0A3P7ZZA2_9TREM|nr:unnamed protein product [Schistosoma margrebowiei]